ncbi:MAG: hypothetical protein NVSMB64_15290 [Candidatus Velthaea sp.]
MILLANRENSGLLARMLGERYDIETDIGQALAFREGEPAGIDLCIIDGPSLARHARALQHSRERQAPVIMPVLLVTDRRDIGLATNDLWRVVDDILLRPVEKTELGARIKAMMRARRQSLRLQQMAHRYEQERRVAQRFQTAAMPRALPDVPGMRFSAFYRPGTDEAQIGGDWYDALRLIDGRVILSIGDVAGSGLNAAVTMAHVRQVLRGVAQIHPDPAMMLDAADRTLQAEEPDRIVTAFVGVYDPATNLFTYACAGHPRPIMRASGGAHDELAAEGLPLGVRARSVRETRTVPFLPGSMLVLYTDGLTEATRNVLEGESALHEAIARADSRGAPEVATAIYNACLQSDARDDVALLVVTSLPGPADESRMLRWHIDSANVSSVRGVQQRIVDVLTVRGASQVNCALAETVFSELIGNVVRYAPGTADIALDWSGPAPVLSVLDAGPGFRHTPKLPLDLLSESGRGLFIIAEMTEEFNVTPRPHGGSHARAVLRVG